MLPKSLFLLFFFLFLPLVACASVPPPDLAPMSPDENATEFIRARCGLTRYPDLCFTSLSSYASAVQRSPVQLARLATNVTLARLCALRAHVSALRRAGAGAPRREAAALRDCAEQLGDAADQVRRTAAELRGLEALVGMEVAWRVSNAQTWMSAALTNEDTCSDGFREVGGGGTSSIRTDVCRRVGRVKQYTSNDLALVNSLVNGG
ncbi:PMEI [Musa troglodytarum]|uniref:PMEI n=1 Tax=Musa troglodytarum TaxID=320322 RepID=A0A9E7KA72_9LILI|nr:PMEI [Musa troglodytarum]